MGNSPTRYEKGEVDLKALAIVWHCEKQEYPLREYLVLMTIKVWNYMVNYCTTDHLQRICKLSDKEMDDTLQVIEKRGWIARDSGYLKVTSKGTIEWFKARAAISTLLRDGFTYKENK